MKLIAHGEVYDYEPPYAELDVDALVEWQHRYIAGVPGLIADAFTAAFSAAAGFIPDLPQSSKEGIS